MKGREEGLQGYTFGGSCHWPHSGATIDPGKGDYSTRDKEEQFRGCQGGRAKWMMFAS